jgi:hypothetical protein
VGLRVRTADRNDASLITRALASFFKDRGFKTNDRGTGPWVLTMNVRFDPLTFNGQMKIYSSRYYIDAALEDQTGSGLFSFTGDQRQSHLIESEARRMAVQAVESSIKKEEFAQEFDAWLNSLID